MSHTANNFEHGLVAAAWGRPEGSLWEVGTPIVHYYQYSLCDPSLRKGLGNGGRSGPMTPEHARQLDELGFNLVCCQTEDDLDAAHAQGLRGLYQEIVWDPTALDDPVRRATLDAHIERIKRHPALYAYYIADEPSATAFPGLGRLVAYLRERDPAHLALINLFPTYASAEALGIPSDPITDSYPGYDIRAYREHLRQYLAVVKPDLISYDHYHFTASGDNIQYFLNLALVREAALNGGVPFINVVQACAVGPGFRTPNGNEGRFLAYTSLAYGAQGIAQFLYQAWEGSEFRGGVVKWQDGTPTPLGEALRQINPEFVAIAGELQPLTSLGAYHLGTVPLGGVGLPADACFTVNPPVPAADFNPPAPVTGILLGYFGVKGNPTHVLVVNLDYAQEITTTVIGPRPLEVFDTEGREWRRTSDGSRAKVSLMAGGGKLLRLGG